MARVIMRLWLAEARPVSGRTPDLIQVCADLDDAATRDREIRALLAAGSEHPGATLRPIALAPQIPRDLPPGIVWPRASERLLSDRAG